MKFFVRDFSLADDFRSIHAAVDQGMRAAMEYRRFLEMVKSKLPNETREFALANWYHDPRSHDCPHDSWLQELTLSAVSPESKLNACLKVLGAYHDKFLVFDYLGVTKFRAHAATSRRPLGDWLYDEFDISPQGAVLHEIEWQHGGTWLFESEKVVFSTQERAAEMP